ncbi:hypothetical protein J2Y60_003429 [Arcicella sp. BE140]|nr:hypothetical protein [Arcicella sp. BE51]MDR6813218.1 hypothetical protein [Arcicella sp. BE140]MDR6824532.1 hypothetical protein [Arcicella sp. BE139]
MLNQILLSTNFLTCKIKGLINIFSIISLKYNGLQFLDLNYFIAKPEKGF